MRFAVLWGWTGGALLDEAWRDIIGVGGFVVTVLGLYYSIVQIRKARSAASAAEQASKQALEECRAAYAKVAVAFSHRFINEAKIHVDNQAWDKAAMRMSDLAYQLTQLSPADPGWGALVEELRLWAAASSRMGLGEIRRFSKPKWIEYCARLEARIDGLFGPFGAAPGDGRNEA